MKIKEMHNINVRTGIQFTFLFFLMNCIAAQTDGKDSLDILKRFKENTIFLSSDQLEGRGAGSEGIKLAAEYISNQFEHIGLQPMSDGTYIQEFKYPENGNVESNIIGIIPASQPTTRSIVFTAHYDGYGILKNDGQKDSIYNGARDNAIGVAALIELAGMYQREVAPEINLVFIATAGEEFGQYGSAHYVRHPIFKADDIVMCMNIDGFNVSGVRTSFFVMPRQGVDFVDDIVLVAQRSGWIYDPPEWVDTMNKYFDSASFLKKGIPSVTLWVGDRMQGGQMAPKLNFGAIHSPKDEINEDWNWEGVIDHLNLYKTLGDHFMKTNGQISVKNPELFE